MSGRQDDYEDRRDEQLDRRLRALGTECPRCSVPGCGEMDPFGLTGVAPNLICREHLADARKRTWVENHHVAGRHNDPTTVPVPANDHGSLSGMQELWPRTTLRNPDGSPLLRMAAWLDGWLDIHRVIVDRAVGRIPAGLERLDERLTEHIGPAWWKTLGWHW